MKRDAENRICEVLEGFPEEVTLSIICGKWKFRILYRLLDGPKRFNNLQRSLNGISPRTLTNQLQDLERYQIIDRKVYPKKPPKVEYSLSNTGKTLIPILELLSDWGKKYCGKIEKNLNKKK